MNNLFQESSRKAAEPQSASELYSSAPLRLCASKIFVFVFFLLCALAPRPARPADAPRKPNVLFILTDDQRADALRFNSNPDIITPNLDALAAHSTYFTNAYCMGGNSAAVCAPSRNMLLSGRTYFRFGRFAEAAKPNLPRSFRDAGYETWHLGKRGNTADEIHKVFEHTAYLDDDKARTCGQPARESIDAALDFLGKRDPSSRPFLMLLELAVPHDPRVASPELMALYDRDKIKLPANYLPQHPFDNGEMEVRDEKLAPWPRTESEIRRHLHEYYAVITGMDREIGRLLTYLDSNIEGTRTIIVFASDNGLALGSHGLMGKQNLYDAGMKVPLFIQAPGCKGMPTQALVYLHDLFPTLCDLAGLPIPEGLDGKSLAPIVRENDPGPRESLFLAYRDVQRAVRDDRYKLIVYPKIAKTQLFDLQEQPLESRDLSADPAQHNRIESMMNVLREWQTRTGDTLPLTVDHPQSPDWTPPTDTK